MVERWSSLFPNIDRITNQITPWKTCDIEKYASNKSWVEHRRQRLAEIPWFMRLLKQRIARRANIEDNVTGHFWEGRYVSSHLFDDAAVVSCMVYNDLNPIRAKMAATPEQSDFTSIQTRFRARQQQHKAQTILADPKIALPPKMQTHAQKIIHAASENSSWLTPILQATNGRLTLDEYCELVDATGRLIANGKRGVIPPHLHPILERLDIDVQEWMTAMRTKYSFIGTAIGTLTNLIQEAKRIGSQCVSCKTALHRIETDEDRAAKQHPFNHNGNFTKIDQQNTDAPECSVKVIGT